MSNNHAISETASSGQNSVKENNLFSEKLKGILFLGGVSGIFFLSGFSSALASSRKNNPKYFSKSLSTNKEDHTAAATELALRALGWGSLYSTVGCSILFYTIWKLSGANNFEEFRIKMGNILPRITKNDSSTPEL